MHGGNANETTPRATQSNRSPGTIYYDPVDKEIDVDPHPTWKRMRDEAPLYRNDDYGFWALSRFDDVNDAIVDWATYLSGRGTVLDMVLAGIQPPAGMFIFEDPPSHDIHRGILTRVFTPRRMNALQPQVRALCARLLDPLVGSSRFDLIQDIGMELPIRVIGMLLGITEADQETIRTRVLRPDGRRSRDMDQPYQAMFSDYIDWRLAEPGDDILSELLYTEFDDGGDRRRLSRDEALGYVLLLAGAGSETTRQLIGWLGKLLADNPCQLRDVAADRSLIPGAIEETLRYEAPSPVQARVTAREVTHHGHTLPTGSIVLLLNGSANRDDRRFPDADRYDVRRTGPRHLGFGHGIHFCMGAALARLEAGVLLDELLTRFPRWHVDLDAAVQAHGPTTRGWERLPLVVD